MRRLRSLALMLVLGAYVFVGLLPVRQVSAQATGAFYTNNSKIYDPYGQEFIPVGANILGPNDPTPWPNAEFGMYDFAGYSGEVDALGMSDEVQAWNWNTVRLNICQDKYCTDKTKRIYTNPDFVSKMDAIVQEYTAKRIVVMPELHELMGDMQTSVERDALLDFWEWAAGRYKDNPYVWFNIANEPGPDPTPGDYTIWQDLHSDAIDIIRGEGANNLIVIDGTWFGQDRSWETWITGTDLCTELPPEESAVLGYSAPLLSGNSNIVFSLHVYEMWGLDECTAQQHRDRLTEYVEGVRALGAPIIVGEVGHKLTEDDLQRIAAAEALYAVAENLNLGILAYSSQDANAQASANYSTSFSLVQSGGFYNVGVDQSNLSAFGQLHWDYSQVMGASITVPADEEESDEGGIGGSLEETGFGAQLIIIAAVGIVTAALVSEKSKQSYRHISRRL